MSVKLTVFTYVVIILTLTTSAYFENDEKDDSCFCQLDGKIDECTCNINTVDTFNNIKIFPRLQSLLRKDYFRFFKVNLKNECPFWPDDSKCAIKFCHVQPCHDDEVPKGIKGALPAKVDETVTCGECQQNQPEKEETLTKRGDDGIDGDDSSCPVDGSSCSMSNLVKETKQEQGGGGGEEEDNLDYLNKTISDKLKIDLERWQKHDESQDSFCVEDQNDIDAEHVDLLLNPERYTGYKGESARRIWKSIYLENCFRPEVPYTYDLYIQQNKLDSMCLEERIYYRAISGLHASINIHLSSIYLLSEGVSFKDPKGEWGPNLLEFKRRFSSETTNGEGPYWLRNLYFIYLLELRALAKAADYLEFEEFYTGNETEDFDTRMAIKDLLAIIKGFTGHFDESIMFRGEDRAKLKYEFKEHFRNVTRIMDCVGCDKCKLWGKLQTKGLGTALRILFTPNLEPGNFKLQREEIVALFNAFGRISTSVYKLDDFKQMTK